MPYGHLGAGWCDVCGLPCPGGSRHESCRSAWSGIADPAKVREQVLERDGFTCQWPGCGFQDLTGTELEVDHVRPTWEFGPALDLSEYQTLCARLGGGGHHRDKSGVEAAERAAWRRGEAVTETASRKTGKAKTGKEESAEKRLKRERAERRAAIRAVVMYLLGGALIGGTALRWATARGVVDPVWWERAVLGGAIVGGALLVGAVAAVVLLRRAAVRRKARARLAEKAESLSKKFAKTYGYSIASTAVRLRELDPLWFVVRYPETAPDDDPAWRALKHRETESRLGGIPLRVVRWEVTANEVEYREDPTRPDPAHIAAPSSADPRTDQVARIRDGLTPILGEKTAPPTVTEVLWSPDRVAWPTRVTLRYPATAQVHTGDTRVDAVEKMEDMLPGVRWGAEWSGATDTVVFTDLGPDPLAETVPPMPITDVEVVRADPVAYLAGLPIGRRENRRPWLLRLFENPAILVGGASGSGKGSVLWSIVRALLPLVRIGYAQVWIVDPKGGMEFGRGRRMWHRFAVDLEDIVALLVEFRDAMKARQAELERAGLRKNRPSKQRPHLVLIVDELAYLTDMVPDRKVQVVIAGLLKEIASQIRAPGGNLIAAVQDPKQDVVKFRGLFTTKFGLRLTSVTQIPMVLGEDARARGARCTKIPADQQGTGYVLVDDPKAKDNLSIDRVRAAFIGDGEDGSPDDIGDMITLFDQWKAEDTAAEKAARSAPQPPADDRLVAAVDLVEGMRVLVDHGDRAQVPATIDRVAKSGAGFVVDYRTAGGEPGEIVLSRDDALPLDTETA